MPDSEPIEDPDRADADLQRLGARLVGRWTTEATHPAIPGTIITGRSEIEWLDGDRFLVHRTHYDHPDFPDAVAVIGDTGGLHMHYFDARGVHRLFEVTVADDGWGIVMGRHAPAGSFASTDQSFSQRTTYAFEPGDHTMSGAGELSFDDVTWEPDLDITYRRVQ